ncbi:MAG: hypothetical protein ACE5D8_06060 [Fidelibacterota bacterium]
MTAIRKNIFIGVAILGIWSCIKPEYDSIWTLELQEIHNTIGYCRDVAIHGDFAFVAAGQAGVQIWDRTRQGDDALIMALDSISPLDDFNDISIVAYDTLNRILFAVENNNRVRVIDVGDPANPEYQGEELSEKSRDVVIKSEPGRFLMLVADNDDGLKWASFKLDTIPVGNDTLYLWSNYAGGEIPTPGAPTGIAYFGNMIAMSVGQKGFELYSYQSFTEAPGLVGRYDTQGYASSVTMPDENTVFVASDDGGAYYFDLMTLPVDTSGRVVTGKGVRFAEGLSVDHVSVEGNVAVLSLGSGGLALYDVSHRDRPESRGIFDIGYTYRSELAGGTLFAATREGLQIIQIKQ